MKMEPKKRLERLAGQAEDVKLDIATPAKSLSGLSLKRTLAKNGRKLRYLLSRYFRSCHEMIRMADVYYQEGNYEAAYVLYLKFLILSLDKLRTHPQYNQVPQADILRNKETAKNVFPKVEKIKKQLEIQFQADYEAWKKEQERKEREDEEKRRREEQIKNEEEKKKVEGPVNHPMPYASGVLAGLKPMTDALPNGQYVQPSDIWFESPEAARTERDPFAGARPEVNRASKPSVTTSVTPDSRGLRSIVISPSIAERFMKIAETNTERNVETCGILAGKLSQNVFVCSHLIIPRQHGTSDSCTTANEEDIFEVQDKHQLLTLGWIHTHPSQTAFLSSIDLHTQCGYQVMMSEALAIVCAPKFEEVGYFRLTESGVGEVIDCRLSGFHPHTLSPPTFQEANHVRFDPIIPLSVIDLRK